MQTTLLITTIRRGVLLIIVLSQLLAGHSVSASGLSDVDHWLYLIDVNLDEDEVYKITKSSHDLIVIDYIPSESENTDYPIAEVIDEWHDAKHAKRVLAYIDIGQAESYRTYWQDDWEVGDPAWITGEDPDGWAENYPVAYWHKNWQAIWLGKDGIISRIVEAGFDGVYLDWIEAYSDPGVAIVAKKDGVNAQDAMVKFITDIAYQGRKQRPGFLVVGQNALELVYRDDYRHVVDGVAQEQTWFDGGADNAPPGDCPLPRRREDVESDAYTSGLSRACRRQHDTFEESTLHMSSEEYLEDMQSAQDYGLVVMTVDYALDPSNVAWIYAESRRRGFVPFVSERGLSTFAPARY
ncbi:MAG: hypothetical protein HON65_08535 [Rhodospirillales bacterium]|nr:hypothetical protein [Rhodospirillales bacterium]